MLHVAVVERTILPVRLILVVIAQITRIVATIGDGITIQGEEEAAPVGVLLVVVVVDIQFLTYLDIIEHLLKVLHLLVLHREVGPRSPRDCAILKSALA
jgi:hypothetical protein